MEIKVTKITDLELAREMCEFTMHGKNSKITLSQLYRCQHSPMRSQIFTVRMYDIPTFVSVHLVRHSVGLTHFVTSNRDDRGGDGKEDRNTPVNHAFIGNAESLINMARKRLCYKSHSKTVEVMEGIAREVYKVDPDLEEYMVPECVYRNGCYEVKSCGYWGAKEK